MGVAVYTHHNLECGSQLNEAESNLDSTCELLVEVELITYTSLSLLNNIIFSGLLVDILNVTLKLVTQSLTYNLLWDF